VGRGRGALERQGIPATCFAAFCPAIGKMQVAVNLGRCTAALVRLGTQEKCCGYACGLASGKTQAPPPLCTLVLLLAPALLP